MSSPQEPAPDGLPPESGAPRALPEPELMRAPVSRSRRYLNGVALTSINIIVSTLTSLLVTATVIRNVGADAWGQWLICGQIATFVGLVDLGMLSMLPREIATAAGRGIDARLSEVQALVAGALVASGRLTLLMAALCVGIVLLLPDSWTAARGALTISLTALVLLFPTRVFHAALVGMQDFAYMGACTLVSSIITSLGTVTVAVLGYGARGLAIAWVIGQVFLGLSSVYRLRTHFRAQWPTLHCARTMIPVRKSIWATLGQALHQVFSASDLMLIGSLLSPTATSVYSSTGRALQIGSNLPMALIESAGPGLAELRAVSQERVRVAARTLLCLVPVTTGLFLVGYVAANPAFVNWWLGPSQFGGRLLTVVIAVSIGCKHYLAILTYAIFYLGKERRPLVISLVTTPLATLVLLLGARELGPIAAPLGVVIATLCVGAPMGLASLAKDLGPEMPALLKHLMAWAWRFVVAMTAAYFLSVWLDGGLMASIAAALLAGAVYVVLVAPLVLSGTMGEYLLARLPRAIERPLSLVRLLLDRWSGRSRLF